MRKVRACGISVLAVVVGMALAGCNSGDKKEEATSSKETTSATAAPATTTKAPYAQTIPDYLKENNIAQAAVKRGDPGAPDINLPFPPGWEDMGANTPAYAWGAIVYTGDPAMATNAPTLIALLSKLTGDVDPKKILEFAPGEMKNLPGYEGDGTGSATTLAGFDAWQIGGTYMKDGEKRAVAQKTVVIPGKDGLYVLQINADGTEDQMPILMDATTVIDEQTTITPAP